MASKYIQSVCGLAGGLISPGLLGKICVLIRGLLESEVLEVVTGNKALFNSQTFM